MHNVFRLGIDYGTSNTVAILAWPDGHVRPLLFDGSPMLPSSVCAGEDGTLIAGQEAARAARLAPERFEPSPKRRIDELDVLLGDRSYPLGELFAATLRRVVAEATRTAGAPIAEVTITHPVQWGPARRALLTEAAGRAGLPIPSLTPEPVAAATYFVDVLDHRVPVGSSIVVYDLGGGTFDACVVRRAAHGFEPLSYEGLDDFGGVDLDALVVGLVGQVAGARAPGEWQRLLHPTNPAELRHSRTLWEDARLAKEALSRQSSAGMFVPLVERDVHVTREQFESSAQPALTRTAEVTMSAIRQARITPADVAGLFLVGGSTRVPMVATLLHQQVGLAPIALEQPEIVVAEGALRHRATSPAPAPATSIGPYPPPGGVNPPSPGIPARPGRRHRRLALVLGICAAAVVVLLVASGVTYYELSQPRALPSDLHANACRYIDIAPLYTKFGVATPSASPVSNPHFKLFTECTLDTSSEKGIGIAGVTFDVEPQAYLDSASSEYARTVTEMHQNHDYPVKTLAIGDGAAVGPLPVLAANLKPDMGLEIVVHKADYLLQIEVDFQIDGNVGEVDGRGMSSIPRHQLDAEADALAQTATASLGKVSTAMN